MHGVIHRTAYQLDHRAKKVLHQLHIEELSGKQSQLNTFHALRNMVVVCNLFEWVYINV